MREKERADKFKGDDTGRDIRADMLYLSLAESGDENKLHVLRVRYYFPIISGAAY